MCETVIKERSRRINDITLEFLEIPEELDVEKKALTKLKITNNASEDEKVKIWSYIYKGSNSISGDREDNLQEINLPMGSSVTVELKNEIEEDTLPGDYKIKVRMQKENRKTSDDFTSNIKLMSSSGGNEVSANFEKTSSTTGNVVYESSDIKAKGYGLYFFLGLLIVLVIFLSFKKGL